MTAATKRRVTKVEYHHRVPAGAPVADLLVALAWAEQRAQSQGEDTTADTWAWVEVDEGGLSIVVRGMTEEAASDD